MTTSNNTPTTIDIINDDYSDLPSHGHVPKKDRRVGRRLKSYPHLDVNLESVDLSKRLVATYILVNKDGTEMIYRRFTRHVPSNGPCFWKENNFPFVILEEVENKTVTYTLTVDDGPVIPTKATLTF